MHFYFLKFKIIMEMKAINNFGCICNVYVHICEYKIGYSSERLKG